MFRVQGPEAQRCMKGQRVPTIMVGTEPLEPYGFQNVSQMDGLQHECIWVKALSPFKSEMS